MTWIWLSVMLVLFGAEVNAARELDAGVSSKHGGAPLMRFGTGASPRGARADDGTNGALTSSAEGEASDLRSRPGNQPMPDRSAS